MKRLLLTLTAMSFIFAEAPDPVGNWKLSGLSVDYLHIARETTDFELCVHYPPFINCDGTSDDIRLSVQTIPAGVYFSRITNGPLDAQSLGGIGVNLNVNIYPEGAGSIAEGSFYPDIELSESVDCVTDLQIFSVNENFTWAIGPRSDFSTTNVLGMTDGLLCDEFYESEDNMGDNAEDDDGNDTCQMIGTTADQAGEAYGFALNTGLFDQTPSTPTPERIPPGLPFIATTGGDILAASCETGLVGAACAEAGIDAQANPAGCQTALVTAGLLSGDPTNPGPLEISIGQCMAADYATAVEDFGGAGWLHGTGISSKFMLNTGNSSMGQILPIDFKLVWDAIDGEASGLGFGDDPDDPNEDGDVSDNDDPNPAVNKFDRILGVPSIPVTEVNSSAACDITGGSGLTAPLAGDVVDTLGEEGIATLLTSGCFGKVLEGAYQGCLDNVNGLCVEAETPSNLAFGGCQQATLAGVTTLCDSTDLNGDGLGSPSEFATGVCAQNLAGAVLAGTCDGINATWQDIVGGVCSTLGVDCTENLADAQVVFDGACQLSSGGAAQNCAEAALGQGLDQAVLECSMLDALVAGADTPDDDTDDVLFYEGACSTVVGPIMADLLGVDSTCQDFSDSLIGNNDAIDTFAAQGNDGVTCTDLFVANAGYDCDDPVWQNNFAAQSESTGYQTCADFSAWLADGASDPTSTAYATANQLAVGVVGETCTDYGSTYVADCLSDSDGIMVSDDTQMYLMNPDAIPARWGFFATYNSLTLINNVGLDGVEAYCASDAGVASGLCENDSNHDFDATCLDDCNPNGSNPECASDCSGRFKLTFFPTCVPEIEARQIVAEFVNLDNLCDKDGDVNFDCTRFDWNYNVDADTLVGSGNNDGYVSEAECLAYAEDEGWAFVNNPGPILPSCDEDEGETPTTHTCTAYTQTVVYHSYADYQQLGGMCGDGDPNDLVGISEQQWCPNAIASGLFEETCAPYGGSYAVIDPTTGLTCGESACSQYHADEEPPAFEQSCKVGDESTDILDILKIIGHIIGNEADGSDQLGGETGCAADVNSDGVINVVDVIAIVNMIINDNGRVSDASEANISITDDNRLVIEADGYIGGVDMIVEFTDNFSFDLADNFAADYKIDGNRAHIIMVNNKSITEVLTMTSGKIVSIVEALVANSTDFVTTSIEEPSIFSVGQAYPNPFNPTTNISLVLNANADLSVKVYNLTGQLVDVIAEGNYSPSTYNWTWKADNLASGVYFIKTQVGSSSTTQKVMLLK